MDLPEVRQIASDIRTVAWDRTALGRDLDALQWNLAEVTLDAVHNFPYVPHPEGIEQFQPVSWTLQYGGNCEDLSCLYAVLARNVGLPCRLVWINQPKAKLNHVAPQVFIYGDWYWAESSINGAMMGEDPYVAAARLERHDVTGTDGMSTNAAAWPARMAVSRSQLGYVIL